LSLRQLIFEEPTTVVETFMLKSVVKALATDDREKTAGLMSKYNLAVLPVTDKDNVLVGIVTVDDVMDVVEEETTEDFYKSAAVETLKMNLSDASVGILYKSRIGWLVVLIFINIIAGAIIAYYEDTITEAIVLISFLPLLIASAGNAGSQAATLAIRALAVGDIRARDWFQITAKELAVATSLGITMGFVVWWLGIWRAGPQVAIVVTLTMMIVVMIGSIIGISLPFLLRKLKMDPAVASAPLVATVSDVFGVLVYFALASAFLGF
ncbi:MAG: Magnesium transporter, partial [Candidatus Kaiserbacteria bacterium GW2011_GWC2_49_12]